MPVTPPAPDAGVRVRDARPEDAAVLGRVHVRAWQRAYRGLMPDAYLDGLSADERAATWVQGLARAPRPRTARLVAEVDGRVAGFAVVGPADGEADAAKGELYAINVDPDVWGRGAGRALLAAATDRLRTAGFAEAVLWVVPGNARACAFYEAAGWSADGAERDEEVLGVTTPEVRYGRAL